MKNYKNLLYWMAAVFILLTRTAAGLDVTINVATEHNAFCNGEKQLNHPAICSITDTLEVGFDTWGTHTTTLTLTKSDPPGIKFSGACTVSWNVHSSSTNWSPSADCLPPPVDQPPTASSNTVLVDEWFTDLPWHQKLSTKDSNLIDVPFVMPYAAIDINKPEVDKNYCIESPARCMLRYGIVNVMTMHRTDTLYLAKDIPSSYNQNCKDNECVQVKLDFQRLHSTGVDTHEAEPATNDGKYGIPSLGFAITESTIFAPWHPWYMGHYCATDYDHMMDAVCYEDYFTTMMPAATEPGKKWLIDFAAIFYPESPNDNTPGKAFGKWCKTGELTCSMWLGKVKFEDNTMVPWPANCDINCYGQILSKSGSLDIQFKKALGEFVDIGRYPWRAKNDHDEKAFKSADAIPSNPFIGYYEMTYDHMDDTLASQLQPENIPYDGQHYLFKATNYVLPKQCTQQDFANARLAKPDEFPAAIKHLKDCSLNFEVHTNGFIDAWKYLFDNTIDQNAVNEIMTMSGGALNTNQYGRTMFMYAGIPEQMIPASFIANVQGGTGTITIHEKMYGSSLYTQYLPMVNPGDQSQRTKAYLDDFWHAFFMSNHMNQTPDHFIRGIRGRTLWHNEYRSNLLYKAEENGFTTKDPRAKHFAYPALAHVDFPAGFQKENAKSPYHGNTCDSCHIRNGSGIPLQPDGKLSQLQKKHGMKDEAYQLWPPLVLDYTYTNKEKDPNNSANRKPIVTPMKLVLFDAKAAVGKTNAADQCSQSGNTAVQPPYNNKFMNFYGNSFHLNQNAQETTSYQIEYVPVNDSDRFYVVDKTPRDTHKLTPYLPQRPKIIDIQTGTGYCGGIVESNSDNWPANCDDVNGQNLKAAIEDGTIGIMQLVGKRLGNTPLIEMIPDAKIKANVLSQQNAFTSQAAGCYGMVAGTRGGANYQDCTNPSGIDPTHKCYISRWGWIGDRASLEDQIANAAYVEMNINTSEGFIKIHPNPQGPSQLVRYNATPLCGPADETCKEGASNSSISEEEVRNMATYQRWIGIPNRSRYQVATSLVVRGEQVFRDSGCSSCHVIDKIPFVANDNMLPDEERAALTMLQNKDITDYPYVSYLGTDLLMHDMGYLSQVAVAPTDLRKPDDGTISKSDYSSYIQKIRTPPLKGLRFNRFITDSNHNTIKPINPPKHPSDPTPIDENVIPGCDFLLHDGRACDAIEAAFLHDGPAVMKLDMIGKLNKLSSDDLTALRAFLYSL